MLPGIGWSAFAIPAYKYIVSSIFDRSFITSEDGGVALTGIGASSIDCFTQDPTIKRIASQISKKAGGMVETNISIPMFAFTYIRKVAQEIAQNQMKSALGIPDYMNPIRVYYITVKIYNSDEEYIFGGRCDYYGVNQFEFSSKNTMIRQKVQSRYRNRLLVSLQDCYKQQRLEYTEAIVGDLFFDFESERYVNAE